MLWCVTAIVTIFGTPRLALRHHLSIHIERAGPTFSPPPKLARDPCETVKFESCGEPKRWLGPLYVYCKLVVESRPRRVKKNSENIDNLMNINKNMAKLG